MRKVLGALALFIIGFGLVVGVFFAVRKKLGRPTDSPASFDVSNVPGLAIGESVDLPELTTLHDRTVRFTHLKEEHFLCVVFSTQCPGCAKDADMWRDLNAEASRRQVPFFVISIDDDKPRVERFAKAYGFDDLNVLFDPNRQVAGVLKITFVPQYLLLNSNGKVLGRWNGVQDYDATKHETSKLAHFFQPIGSASLVTLPTLEMTTVLMAR